MISQNIIKNGQDLYVLKRILVEKETFNIDLLKQLFHVDTCLRKDGRLFFCNKIQELEYEQIESDSDEWSRNIETDRRIGGDGGPDSNSGSGEGTPRDGGDSQHIESV